MGKSCARTTIDEVLEAARIDPDGQQLIAQGRITEIVRRTPLRRREILDEVSGIAAYDEKRDQAILELKEVKSKLNTHRMLLAERRRRLLGLQKERDAALAYQALAARNRTGCAARSPTSGASASSRSCVRPRRSGRAWTSGSARSRRTSTQLDREIENKEWELEGMQEDLGGGSQIAMVKEVERLRSETLHKQADIQFKRQQMANIQEMIDEISRMRAAAAPAAAAGASPRESPAVQALIERKRGGVYGTVASLGRAEGGLRGRVRDRRGREPRRPRRRLARDGD